MTEEEKQAAMVQLKKVPKPVQTATMIAFLLGLITLVRMPVAAYAMNLSIGKGLLGGLVMSLWFFICGTFLCTRSRWGYAGLILFSLLPLPGLFGLSAELVDRPLTGMPWPGWPELVHDSIAAVQLVVTVVLLGYLVSKRVRDFVWKRATSR